MKIYKKKPDNPNYYDIRGTSMLPTLKAGEGVIIDMTAEKELFLKGDIIIYPDPKGRDINIVHRIVTTSKGGYITRGDNNRRADDYIVKFESVIGKVLKVKKVTETVNVIGGFRGMLLHRKLRIKKFCLTYFFKHLSIVSKAIDKSRILNFFHKFIKVDVIEIKKERRADVVLLHKNILIGRKCPDTGKWIIRFPYKYFINKMKLQK